MIDRDAFDAYDRALTTNAALVERAVDELVRRCAELSGSAFETALAEGYRSLVVAYGSFAAQAAVEFYRSQRSASGVLDGYEAAPYSPDDEGLCRYDVRSALDSNKARGAIIDHLGGTSRQRVMERADETLMRNAQADPAHPRWALVPHIGACDWCKMLGSRGFAYRARATVMASRHSNCVCTPVVDFDVGNPSLDGYDPDALFDYYMEHTRDKYAVRRTSSGGGRGGRAPVEGLGSIGDVSRFMKEAGSIEELARRNDEAVKALRALFPRKSAYEKAFSQVRQSATARYSELRRLSS